MKNPEQEGIKMTIRKADLGDIPHMEALYDAARSSLAGMGVDQWQDGYPNARTAREDIENGIAWVVEENGAVLATAAVFVGVEPTYGEIFDGAWKTQGPTYGVIHRIAVDPAAKKRGLASAIMAHCTALSRAAGVASQRCDTHRDNVPMRRTLERNGYEYCGVIVLESGAARVAYEKVLN